MILCSVWVVSIPLARAQVAEAPADLMDRRVEITGPVDRKMVREEGRTQRKKGRAKNTERGQTSPLRPSMLCCCHRLPVSPAWAASDQVALLAFLSVRVRVPRFLVVFGRQPPVSFVSRSSRRILLDSLLSLCKVINGLNSGASTYMADFEDSSAPTWANMVRALSIHPSR